MRSFADARSDFPSLSRPLAYFDGPGGTQVPRQVIAAISGYYERSNANTHGAFVTSAETDEVIAAARAAAAAFLGAASPASISFGQNMTTLNFALARAIAREIREGDEVVVTQLDHEANRGPWKTLAERGAVLREIPLRADGTLEMSALDSLIGKRTRLLAIGWASNALGTVNDVARAVAAARAAGARSVIDAVHYAPHFSIDAAALDPDFLLCSAYKFYGPHVGILYAKPGALDALETDRLITQDQEAPYRIETGTLNHAALAGVTAAIDYLASFGEGDSRRARLVSAMERLSAHERALALRTWRALDGLPRVRRWGPEFTDAPRAPTVSITVEGLDARAVTERLAAAGIAAWDGDFYARRAVEIFGLADKGGLVRSGMAMYTTEEEADRLSEAIRSL
jgi:cysteine desulfurase family protein (TIGR01976 family)